MENVSIHSLYKLFTQNLLQIYEQSEIKAIFFKICQDCFNLPKYKILTQINTVNQNGLVTTDQIILSANQHKQFLDLLKRLKSGEPLQYILGYADFCNYRLKVAPGVLIPRPETEELVSYVLTENLISPSILDIGTGSGCIAIALALEYPRSLVYALDISEIALEIASQNAQSHKAEISFIKNDIFNLNLEFELPNFDIIVSNPPYVCNFEKHSMHLNVLNYEPHEALFVPDNNPLLYYARIASFALQKLNPGGVVWLEINHQFGIETATLFYNSFNPVTIHKDISGRNRFVRAVKP